VYCTSARSNQAQEEFTFTCGAVLSDLELGEERLDGEHVFVRSLRCYEPLEKLYYSVGSYEHICIYCCSSENIFQKQDKRKCNFTGSDVIIMNNEYLPPALVVG